MCVPMDIYVACVNACGFLAQEELMQQSVHTVTNHAIFITAKENQEIRTRKM